MKYTTHSFITDTTMMNNDYSSPPTQRVSTLLPPPPNPVDASYYPLNNPPSLHDNSYMYNTQYQNWSNSRHETYTSSYHNPSVGASPCIRSGFPEPHSSPLSSNSQDNIFNMQQKCLSIPPTLERCENMNGLLMTSSPMGQQVQIESNPYPIHSPEISSHSDSICTYNHHKSYFKNATPIFDHDMRSQYHVSSFNIPSIQEWFDKHEHHVINNTNQITRRGSITKVDTIHVSSAVSLPTSQESVSHNHSYCHSFKDFSVSKQVMKSFRKSKISKQSKSNTLPPAVVVNILGNEYSDFINNGTIVKKKKSIKFKFYTPKM